MKKTKKIIMNMVMLAVLAGTLSGCGSKVQWVGTYGGTSTNNMKVEISVNKDGTVEYEENGTITEGIWTKNENSINLDFSGEVSSESEPLIITMSSDGTTITVESDDSGWNADTYQRR